MTSGSWKLQVMRTLSLRRHHRVILSKHLGWKLYLPPVVIVLLLVEIKIEVRRSGIGLVFDMENRNQRRPSFLGYRQSCEISSLSISPTKHPKEGKVGKIDSGSQFCGAMPCSMEAQGTSPRLSAVRKQRAMNVTAGYLSPFDLSQDPRFMKSCGVTHSQAGSSEVIHLDLEPP